MKKTHLIHVLLNSFIVGHDGDTGDDYNDDDDTCFNNWQVESLQSRRILFPRIRSQGRASHPDDDNADDDDPDDDNPDDDDPDDDDPDDGDDEEDGNDKDDDNEEDRVKKAHFR